jgi:exodeoxyribonuclease V alpha subunit
VSTLLGEGPTEALAGLVEWVIYHNAETDFCVLRVEVHGHRELLTVVGHAATIAAGEWVQISGTWIDDRTHGLTISPKNAILARTLH